MLTCKAFVPVLVVAGYASHELLFSRRAKTLNLSYEVFRVAAPKSCGSATAMHHLEFASLEAAIREAKIVLLFSHSSPCRWAQMPKLSVCGDLAPELAEASMTEFLFGPAAHLVGLAEQAACAPGFWTLSFVMHKRGNCFDDCVQRGAFVTPNV